MKFDVALQKEIESNLDFHIESSNIKETDNRRIYYYPTCTLEMVIDCIKENHKIFEGMMKLDAMELKYKDTKYVNEKGIDILNETSLEYFVIKIKEIFKWLKTQVKRAWTIISAYLRKATEAIKKFLNKNLHTNFETIDFVFYNYMGHNPRPEEIDVYKTKLKDFITKNLFDPTFKFDQATTEIIGILKELHSAYKNYFDTFTSHAQKCIVRNGIIEFTDDSYKTPNNESLKNFLKVINDMTLPALNKDKDQSQKIYTAIVDRIDQMVPYIAATEPNNLRNAMTFKALFTDIINDEHRFIDMTINAVTKTLQSISKNNKNNDKSNTKSESTIDDLEKELTILRENTFIDENNNVFIYDNNLGRSIQMANIGRFNLATGLQEALLENAYDQISILEAQLKREKILRQYADNPAITESALQSFEEASWEGVKDAVKNAGNTVITKIKQWATAFAAWVKSMWAKLKNLIRNTKAKINGKFFTKLCNSKFVVALDDVASSFESEVSAALKTEAGSGATLPKTHKACEVLKDHDGNTERVEFDQSKVAGLSAQMDKVEKASLKVAASVNKTVASISSDEKTGPNRNKLAGLILHYLGIYQSAAKYFAATCAKACAGQGATAGAKALPAGKGKEEDNKRFQNQGDANNTMEVDGRNESALLLNSLLPDMIYREFMASDSHFETDEYGFVEEVA